MSEEESKKKKGGEPENLLGGTLNILGLKIDLGQLLSSSGDIVGRLEDLREKLKAAGGKEAVSDEDWRQGRATVTGHIRTRGPLGEREFHVGTMGKARRTTPPTRGVVETEEPPLDVFDEGGHVQVVADVPGVGLEDLDVTVDGRALSISTRPKARRQYRKTVQLPADVDAASLSKSCRNGVLEVTLQKKKDAGPR